MQMKKITTTTYTKKRKGDATEFTFKTVQDIIDFSNLPLLEKLKVVNDGFTKNQLEDIRSTIYASYAMLYGITGIQSHSFTIKKGSDLFSPRHTEAIVQMLNIYGWGYNFFGDCGAFNKLMYYGCVHGKFGYLKELGATFLGREHICMHIVDINNEHDDLVAFLREIDPIPAERSKRA